MLSVAMSAILELQLELQLKVAKWYSTTDIAKSFFQSLWQQNPGHPGGGTTVLLFVTG